jgi:hypothetical protein
MPAMPGAKVASVCGGGICNECVVDGDCAESSPFCVTAGTVDAPLFRTCAACQTDQQCSGATPHCKIEVGGGRCVACVSNAECAQGICGDGRCVAECDAARACKDPFSACTASQRCEPRSCASGSDCAAANAACEAGHCQRRRCMFDTDCDAGGSCVNGACYEMLGSCFTNQGVP